MVRGHRACGLAGSRSVLQGLETLRLMPLGIRSVSKGCKVVLGILGKYRNVETGDLLRQRRGRGVKRWETRDVLTGLQELNFHTMGGRIVELRRE